MKITSKVIEGSSYNAVFALETPVQDNSGISHLTEHMVFRGSNKYPANHELFLINTLLPANINASTQNGVTFYFINSIDESLFITLLDYLASGLLQVAYDLSEFLLERDGVIFQELKMYERRPHYSLSVAALRGDKSADNIHHCGGFSDTISENSLEDLILYKHRFYQEKLITLYISGPRHINFKLDSILSRNLVYKDDNSCAPKSERCSIRPENSDQQDSSSKNIVITWRIHIAYLADCKTQIHKISKLLKDTEEIIIEEEVNESGLFAFRVITNRPNEIIPVLIKALRKLSIKNSGQTHFHFNHHDASVRNCVQSYLNKRIDFPPALSFDTYLNSHKKSRLLYAQSQAVNKTHNKALILCSKICQVAKHHLSLENVPPLPKLFHEVIKQDNAKFFIFENINWVFDLSDVDPVELQASIISPDFWTPRTNGECYAIGVGRYNGRLFAYGAEDCKAQSREGWLYDMFQ